MDASTSDSFLSLPRSASFRPDGYKDSGNASASSPRGFGCGSVTVARTHPKPYGRTGTSTSTHTPGFSHRKGTSRSSSASYRPLTTPSSLGGSSERTSSRTPATASTPGAMMSSVVVGERRIAAVACTNLLPPATLSLPVCLVMKSALCTLDHAGS